MPADATRVDQFPGDGPLLIDARDLARLLTVSPATIWRMRAAGRLPAPIRLTGSTLRWRRSEVLAWLDAGCPDLTAVEHEGASQ